MRLTFAGGPEALECGVRNSACGTNGKGAPGAVWQAFHNCGTPALRRAERPKTCTAEGGCATQERAMRQLLSGEPEATGDPEEAETAKKAGTGDWGTTERGPGGEGQAEVGGARNAPASGPMLLSEVAMLLRYEPTPPKQPLRLRRPEARTARPTQPSSAAGAGAWTAARCGSTRNTSNDQVHPPAMKHGAVAVRCSGLSAI